jgi:hypothetical protein
MLRVKDGDKGNEEVPHDEAVLHAVLLQVFLSTTTMIERSWSMTTNAPQQSIRWP